MSIALRPEPGSAFPREEKYSHLRLTQPNADFKSKAVKVRRHWSDLQQVLDCATSHLDAPTGMKTEA